MTTLAGKSTSRVELHVPRYGSPWASGKLVVGAVPLGKVSLVVADLTFALTIPEGRAGFDEPDHWHWTAIGGAGWDTPLPKALAWQTDAPAGVRLMTVLGALAKACGETIKPPADVSLGAAWSRPASTRARPLTGRDVLASLIRAGVLPPYWVDATGLTRFDARPGGTVTTDAQASPGNAARGVRRLQLGTSVAGFLPGRTYQGIEIGRLVVHETGSALAVEIWP